VRSVPRLILCLLLLGALSCAGLGAAEPAAGWQIARQLTPLETEVIEVSASSNGHGEVLVAWTADNGANQVLWGVRYQADRGWGSPLLLASNASANITQIDVAVGEEGTGVIAWVFDSGSSQDVWACRYEPGFGWGAAELLEFNDSGPSGVPKVAVDSAGNATIVWEQRDSFRYNIWATRIDTTGAFSEPVQVDSEDLGDARDPEIAGGANGTTFVVWRQSDGMTYSIWAAVFQPVTGWAPATLLEQEDGGNAAYQKVAADSRGGAVAVWAQGRAPGPSTISASHYDSNTGWTGPRGLDRNNVFFATLPAIAMNGGGMAVAAWMQSDGSKNDLWATFSDTNGTWGTAGIVDSRSEHVFPSPTVSIDDAGVSVASWRQATGQYIDVWSSSHAPGSSWTTPLRIEENNMGNATMVDLQDIERGRFLCLWMQTNGAVDGAWVNDFVSPDNTPPLLDLREPANGSIVVTPSVLVGGFTDANTQITVNDALLISNSNGSFEMRVPLAPGPNPITIRAIDEAGNYREVNLIVFYEDPVPALLASINNLSATSLFLEETLAGIRQELNDSVAGSAAIRVDLVTVWSSLNETQRRLDETLQEVANLSASLTSSAARAEDLQVQMSGVIGSLSSINRSLSNVSAELSSVQSRIVELESDVETNARNIDDARPKGVSTNPNNGVSLALLLIAVVMSASSVVLSLLLLRRRPSAATRYKGPP